VLADGFQGVLGSEPRPESEGRGSREVRLEDRLQHQLGRRLHHPVPDGRYPQGAVFAVAFGDLHPPDRLGAIGLLPERLRDLRQERLDPVRLDRGQRLLVDPGGALVLAHLLPRFLQDVAQRELVIQRVEPAGGLALRGLVELRLELGRPWLGRFSLGDTHRTDLLSSRGSAARPFLPGSSVVSPVQAVLCPAPTPFRLAFTLARAEEGLSSSSYTCPCIPSPLRRRVLRGCASQGFTPSVVFALARQARLPLVPRRSGVHLTARQTSRNATDCRFARLPSRRLCQRASPAGSLPRVSSVPLSYSAAGSLPRLDLPPLVHV
jgi:hypothetical protein